MIVWLVLAGAAGAVLDHLAFAPSDDPPPLDAAHPWPVLADWAVGVRGPAPTLDGDATSDLLVRLEEAEGYRSQPYADPGGGWGIGIGHWSPTKPSGSMDPDEAMVTALDDVDRECGIFASGFPLADQPEAVRSALCDAAFQLGGNGLLGFHDALSALGAGDCETAAADFMDSAWASETPSRALALTQTIEEDGCR